MTEQPLDDAAGFAALTAKISGDRGFGCASYKEKCLRRRIAVRMRARAVHTFHDYARLLDTDPAEYDKLLDALTINVTKLFRNVETYNAIASDVLPALWARNRDIRVWSAGCASGEETYSLAILFLEQIRKAGPRNVRVLGTDIDRASLAAAERGEYMEAAFVETDPQLRARYFEGDPPRKVGPAPRALVDFHRRDMLREPPPERGLQMIVCRNVLIYFDRHSQEELFGRFHDALEPGGFLVLGKVETLLGPTRALFNTVTPRERIFRRPDGR
jgi:chemotaxis protein methyltransferase CheR